jgi:DNA-directed RNA polymerase subunit beta
LELHFGDFYFGEPKYPEEECRERDITFSAPLWVKVKLVNRDTGEVSEQEVFMGDFPLMTDAATFIINGSERVVVSQLIRSPGVYFTVETGPHHRARPGRRQADPQPRRLAGV